MPQETRRDTSPAPTISILKLVSGVKLTLTSISTTVLDSKGSYNERKYLRGSPRFTHAPVLKQVIQRSQFKPPVRSKVYTVKSGVAKPLYRRLLSKVLSKTRVYRKPPTNDLLANALPGLRIRGRSSLLTVFISIYAGVILPFSSPSSHIVYADPIASYSEVKPVAQLKMPVLAAVEAVSELPLPITPASPIYSFANSYAPGNCTWYVASRLPIPNSWGNANTWGTMAAAQGYTVSDIPRVGAVAWNTTDSYLGHVALVEAVTGGVVTVSEMNFNGLGVVDNRVANPGEFRYIYV